MMTITIAEQLHVAAHRILTDGRRHSIEAWAWAMRRTSREAAEFTGIPLELERELRPDFSLRELSLGATQWH